MVVIIEQIKRLANENQAVWSVATETFINYDGMAELTSQIIDYQVLKVLISRWN